MKRNMGNTDKIIRLIVAAILAFLVYNGNVTGTLSIVLLVVAIVFALTSLLNYCPLYSIVKVNTHK